METPNEPSFKSRDARRKIIVAVFILFYGLVIWQVLRIVSGPSLLISSRTNEASLQHYKP